MNKKSIILFIFKKKSEIIFNIGLYILFIKLKALQL